MGRIYIRLIGDEGGTRLDECPDTCLGNHERRLWTIDRKMQPWGHFATAVINRRREVIDASLPHRVESLPKDAVLLPPAEVARLWHEDNESHVFGGPNIARMLRRSIAETNAMNERAARDG